MKNNLIKSDFKGTFFYVSSKGQDQDKLNKIMFSSGKFTSETIKVDSSNINNLSILIGRKSIHDNLIALSVNNLEPDSQEKLDII